MKNRWWTIRAREKAGADDTGAGDTTADSVQTTAEGETIGTGNNARLALLNGINDQLDEERGDELANVNDDGTTEPFRTEAATPNSEDDPTATPANEPASAESASEEEKFEIKVNGKTRSLTRDELIARAQKVESADEYLRAAKNPPKVEPQVQPSREELQRLADEEDRALVRAIQVGTEEEATAALRKLREQASTRPSVSADDVSRTVDERLAFNAAINGFRTEFKDIVTDPLLNKLALDRDNELLAAGDTRPYAERYHEIGTTLRAWKQSLAEDIHPAATDTSTKLERKAAAPKPVTPAAGKNAPVRQEDDSEESPSSVIQAMREKRGGPQWMRN